MRNLTFPYKSYYGFNRKSNEIYMNGSTWPKIGSDPVVNHKTSIIPRARKNENRYSLSVLSNDQRKLDTTDTPSMDLFVRSVIYFINMLINDGRK